MICPDRTLDICKANGCTAETFVVGDEDLHHKRLPPFDCNVRHAEALAGARRRRLLEGLERACLAKFPTLGGVRHDEAPLDLRREGIGFCRLHWHGAKPRAERRTRA